MFILDIGCSNGTLGQHLKSLVVGRKVLGIEFDPSFADTASRRLDCVIEADLNTMDWDAIYGDEVFDCLIFADILEHLVDPGRCLNLALQRLAPGGCVIVSLPNVRHISALWSIFFIGTFPKRERGIFDRTHLRWYTYRDAKSLLFENGLQISSESFALRWRDQGGGLINRILNRLPLSVQRFPLIRELFSYQVCFRAIRRTVSTLKCNGVMT